jgi:hypothetical protein
VLAGRDFPGATLAAESAAGGGGMYWPFATTMAANGQKNTNANPHRLVRAGTPADIGYS